MILLDTNALIWIDGGASTRARGRPPLPFSSCSSFTNPASLRLRNATTQWVMDDERWLVDEPPAGSWFLRAVDVSWTHDPFDRLLVAHAQVRRWRLATGDARMLEHLGPGASVQL